MKLLWLKEIIGDAYTEDMDAAACQAIGKDFVARADFNAKNTRVKELEAQVNQLHDEIIEEVGYEFNINSPKSLFRFMPRIFKAVI